MGKGNEKPSKKMNQTSIKDAANVIRISRRHTRDWHLIGLERQRLRTGRPRSPSRSRLRSRSPPRSSTVWRDLSRSKFNNVSKWKYFAWIWRRRRLESQGRHHLMAMEPSMRNACRTHQTTKKSFYPRFVFFSLNSIELDWSWNCIKCRFYSRLW